MDWLISIFITLGIGLFMYGLTSPIISPEIAKLSGLILILIGIWLAIRYERYKKKKEPKNKFKNSFDDITWDLEQAKSVIIYNLPPGYLEQHAKAKSMLERNFTPKETKKLNKIWDRYRKNTEKYYDYLCGERASSTASWPKKFLIEIETMFKKIDNI